MEIVTHSLNFTLYAGRQAADFGDGGSDSDRTARRRDDNSFYFSHLSIPLRLPPSCALAS